MNQTQTQQDILTLVSAEGYTPLIRAFLGILSETSAQRPAT